MKQISILGVFAISMLVACGTKEKKAATAKEDKITVAAYYFPNYHTDDARNTEFKGEGWAEWELVKSATPLFQKVFAMQDRHRFYHRPQLQSLPLLKLVGGLLLFFWFVPKKLGSAL